MDWCLVPKDGNCWGGKDTISGTACTGTGSIMSIVACDRIKFCLMFIFNLPRSKRRVQETNTGTKKMYTNIPLFTFVRYKLKK